MFEVVVVVRGPHRREIHHCGQPLLEPIRKTVDRDEGRIARFDERIAFRRRHFARQRHQAIVEERINRARGFDREPGEKFHRLLQVPLALGQHRRHCFEPLSRGQGARSRSVILLFQERENSSRAFADVHLRIFRFGLQDAVAEIEILQLRPKQQPIDPVILGPFRGRHGAHLIEEFADVLVPLADFSGRKIGKPIVPRVKTRIAAGDWEILITPRVEFVRHFAKRGDVGAGFDHRRRGFRNQRLVRNVRLRFRCRLSE